MKEELPRWRLALAWSAPVALAAGGSVLWGAGSEPLAWGAALVLSATTGYLSAPWLQTRLQEPLKAELESSRREARREKDRGTRLEARLDDLSRLVAQVSASPDFDGLCQRLVEAARELLGVSAVTLYLTEWDHLVFRAGAGLDTGPLEESKIPGNLPGIDGLDGGFLELDEQPLPDHPLLRGRLPASLLGRYYAAPLVNDEVQTGLLEALVADAGAPLSQDQTELLALLARLAALAVDGWRLQHQLQHHKGFSEAVLEHMGDGVFTLGRRLELLTFNRSAELITGWLRDQVVGRPFLEVFPDAQLEAAFRGALEGAAEPVPAEARLQVRDGVLKFLLFHPTVLGELSGQALIVVFRDVTQVREMEKLRSDFTTTLSHELRTPLTCIKGYLHTLMHKKAADFPPEKTRKTLAIINHQVDSLGKLIADLLEAARLGSKTLDVHPRPVELAQLVSSVVDAYREQEPRYSLRCDASPPLATRCDPDQIRYVLDHLLSNAVKYSVPGGAIEVRCLESDGMVCLAVRDEGVGIPFDQQEKIFEMYHRVETENTRTHYGVGVGLYIARRIIEAHGGEIRVESAPGYGSTFSFTLPRASVEELTAPDE